MQIRDFSGGINNVADPSLIGNDQGEEYENIDNSKKVLAPIPSNTILATKPDNPEISFYSFYYEAIRRVLYLTSQANFVEFQNNVYALEKGGNLVVYRKSQTHEPVGAEVPKSSIRITGTKITGRDDTNYPPIKFTAVPIAPSNNNAFQTKRFAYLFVDALTTDSQSSSSARTDLSYSLVVYIPTVTQPPSTQTITWYVLPLDPPKLNITDIEDIRDFELPSIPFPIISRLTPCAGTVFTLKTAITVPAGTSDVRELLIYRYFVDGTNEDFRLVGSFKSSNSVNDVINDTTENLASQIFIDTPEFSPKFNGTYQYLYTLQRNSISPESVPGPLSNELTVQNVREMMVRFWVNQTIFKDFLLFNIYRIGRNITQFSKVAQGNISDLINANSRIDFIDKLSDSEIDGQVLSSQNNYPPPKGGKNITEHYGRLFLIKDDKLFFSSLQSPEIWPPANSFDFDQNLTGLGSAVHGLLLFSSYCTYLLRGNTIENFFVFKISNYIGCENGYSVSPGVNGSVFWWTGSDISISSGGQIVLLTKDRFVERPSIALSEIRQGFTFDNVYYLIFSNNKILCYDFRYAKPIIKILSLNVSSMTRVLNEIQAVSLDGNQLLKIGSGVNFLPAKYKSPIFTEESQVVIKAFKKLFIRYLGSVIISVYVDNIKVITKTLNSSVNKTEQIMLPKNYERGFTIQYEVDILAPMGVVYEIGLFPPLTSNTT